MSKKQSKKVDAAQMSNEEMQQELIEDLKVMIPAIVQSGIPDDRKLFYLYLIAEGSFSARNMEDVQKDMEKYSQEQEAYIADKESEIADLEAQIAALDKQLDEVATQHALDLKKDTDELIHLAAAHAEEAQKGQHKASIKQLKKRLSE